MEACNASPISRHSSARGRLSVPILRKIEMSGEREKAWNSCDLGVASWRLIKIERHLTLHLV